MSGRAAYDALGTLKRLEGFLQPSTAWRTAEVQGLVRHLMSTLKRRGVAFDTDIDDPWLDIYRQLSDRLPRRSQRALQVRDCEILKD